MKLMELFSPIPLMDILRYISQMCCKLDVAAVEKQETLLEKILRDNTLNIWQRLAAVVSRNQLWRGCPIGLVCAQRFLKGTVQKSLKGKNNEATEKNFAKLTDNNLEDKSPEPDLTPSSTRCVININCTVKQILYACKYTSAYIHCTDVSHCNYLSESLHLPSGRKMPSHYALGSSGRICHDNSGQITSDCGIYWNKKDCCFTYGKIDKKSRPIIVVDKCHCSNKIGLHNIRFITPTTRGPLSKIFLFLLAENLSMTNFSYYQHFNAGVLMFALHHVSDCSVSSFGATQFTAAERLIKRYQICSYPAYQLTRTGIRKNKNRSALSKICFEAPHSIYTAEAAEGNPFDINDICSRLYFGSRPNIGTSYGVCFQMQLKNYCSKY